MQEMLTIDLLFRDIKKREEALKINEAVKRLHKTSEGIEVISDSEGEEEETVQKSSESPV